MNPDDLIIARFCLSVSLCISGTGRLKSPHEAETTAWLPPRHMTTARVVTTILRLMPVVPTVYSSGDPLRSPCGGLFNRPVSGMIQCNM